MKRRGLYRKTGNAKQLLQCTCEWRNVYVLWLDTERSLAPRFLAINTKFTGSFFNQTRLLRTAIIIAVYVLSASVKDSSIYDIWYVENPLQNHCYFLLSKLWFCEHIIRTLIFVFLSCSIPSYPSPELPWWWIMRLYIIHATKYLPFSWS